LDYELLLFDVAKQFIILLESLLLILDIKSEGNSLVFIFVYKFTQIVSF